MIVAADVIGSGCEHSMLLPMIEQSAAQRKEQTLISADAGYHSDANVRELMAQGIPALIACNQMRSRDERFNDQDKHKAKDDPLYDKQPTGQAKTLKRFSPQDFRFNGDNSCICPAGRTLTSSGSTYTTATGQRYQLYAAQDADCHSSKLRDQCLKSPQNPCGRQVTRFEPKASDPSHPSERMRRAIDSPQGRRLYSQRIGTVEPVFGNIRHNKRLARLNLRGREKVNTQWHLYCMVHNIEKLTNHGYAQ